VARFRRIRAGVVVRGAVALAVGAGLLVACDPAPAPAPPAGEVYSRPASGVFTLSGHAWGHGHGMSQWGAQGAATLGKSADEILSTYYPGTARTLQANSALRVLLSADDTVDQQVLPASGLTVTDGQNRRLTLPAGPRRWRVVADAAGLHLQRLDATWAAVPVAGATTLSSPVRFTSGSGLVAVVFPDGSSRDYRGTATAVRRTAGGLYSTVAVPMESYLRSVVPLESSPSWKPAALQAQAVAARTYAAQRRSVAAAGSAYDICDSSACQVFAGSSRTSSTGSRTGNEYASTDAAIAATAGHIRTWAGKPAFTEFGSSNGGWSTSGNQPYLVAKADPWDGAVPNPVHAWSAKLPVSSLEARFPAVGKLQRLRVVARDGNGDWGGRVSTVVLEGQDVAGRPTSVTTTGSGIAAARSWPSYSDGLRSNWWRIDNGGSTTSSNVVPVPPTTPAPAPAPALRATPVTVPAPPPLSKAPGRGVGDVVVTFRNTGTANWTLSALRLSAVTAADGTLAAPGAPAPARNLTRAGSAVLPNDLVEVRARLDASAVPAGTHQVAYQLMAPGFVLSSPLRWNVPVAAASYPPAPALFADRAALDWAPTLVRTGATSELVVRFRNAGTRSWTLSVLRLNPAGLKDTTFVASGVSPSARNLSRSGSTVLPNDVVEVRLRVDGTRVSAGSYRASYRLLAPGFLLSEPVSWPLTVR
jgi:SpoIID/LytB domain protein